MFAVGFVVRPLGGVLLGNVADRLGRRRVMLLSVGLMAATTMTIAVMPTYATIGAWAGVLLLLCRVLQGLSTGIEAPLSTAYAIEVMPSGHEGRAAGYISFFVNLGIVMASLASFLTSYVIGGDAMSDWGWRVPMLLGAAMSVFVLYLRRALPETLSEQEKSDNVAGTWGGVGHHWLGLAAIIFVVGAAQAYNYAWNVGLPSLASGTFGEDPTKVFALTTGLGVILLVGSIVTGRVADRVRLSRAFIVTRILAVPGVFLMLLYAAPGLGMFAAVLLVGGILLVANMTLYNVVSHVPDAEVLPRRPAPDWATASASRCSAGPRRTCWSGCRTTTCSGSSPSTPPRCRSSASSSTSSRAATAASSPESENPYAARTAERQHRRSRRLRSCAGRTWSWSVAARPA